MIHVGDILEDKYKILKEIGKGGMSVVYLAVDMRLNKKWAVKEHRKEAIGRTNSVIPEGLQKEAEVIKRLDHPVLPRIVDIIYTDDTACIVMDYIEGKTLSDVLKAEGPIAQKTVISWAESICEALSYMHGMNPPVIYRDMKPSNIMLRPDGSIKLIDFGAALEGFSNGYGSVYSYGTIGYAAPEQLSSDEGIKGNVVDERADIYSLGVTIYTLITGNLPKSSEVSNGTIEADSLKLSGGLKRILQKCMAKNPDDRYQSCEELKFYLNNCHRYDKEHIKRCRKDVCAFVAMSVLALCFSAMSVSGYVGINAHRDSDYEEYINRGLTYIINNDYEAAADSYIAAVTEVDGSRPEAYIELLKLYENYLDMPEDGLSIVGHYIDENYENVDENSELIIKVGLDYFELVKDYQKSAYYFGLVDADEYPEAELYRTIAYSMYKLEISHDELSVMLVKLYERTEKMPLTYHKLQNYELICDVYSKNMNELENAASSLVKIADKGILQLEKYEDESTKTDYYIAFNQYIITGCEELGREYYDKALKSCDDILGIVSKDDSVVMGIIRAEKYRQSKLIKKAELLAKLSRYNEAFEIYEKAEVEFGDDAAELYIGHLELLCDIEAEKTPNVEAWESAEIIDIYEKGSRIAGIENDYRWRRLKVRIQPILENRDERQP